METPKSDQFERAFGYVQGQVRRAIKRAALRLEQYKMHLEECKNWRTAHHRAELLQANLFRIRKGMHSIQVSDWEKENKEIQLALDPLVEPSEQLKELFRKSRKLRLGEPHLLKQTFLAEDQLKKYEQQMDQLGSIVSKEQLQIFCSQNRYLLEKKQGAAIAKRPAPRLPYERYLTAAEMEIWVGKSAKDNDALTFQHANGSDYWLHVRDHPGSHVVLHGTKNVPPDPESLDDAAELALRFSKCKENAEVCLTQVKYVKKVKGVPGKVMLSKQRVLFWKMDQQRWVRLKASRFKNN